MASVNVPDFDAKLMWRKLRAFLWTFLCAFAAACFLQVMLPSVSRASAGETSSETKPSAPSDWS
jgi:hypothetical protein